jgi:hypothetical protein
VLSAGGILSGTPTSSGAFSFTAQVTDLATPTEVGHVIATITIIDPVVVTTAALPNTSPGVFYNSAVAVTGGTAPYSWKVTQGSLPAGLTLNGTTGVISGVTTDLGSSSFTVQVSDSQTPAVSQSVSLGITAAPAPPRNSALYFINGASLQIQSDGSLTPLPSFKSLSSLGPSPTLPILFTVQNSPTPILNSILVNTDYSLSPIHSISLPPVPTGSNSAYGWPKVDPTGSNLYLPGYIDAKGTPGTNIYTADGSLQLVGTAPGVVGDLQFTPDGASGFVGSCPSNGTGSILSYSRGVDGLLVLTSTYTLPNYYCAPTLRISHDARYMAAALTPNGPNAVPGTIDVQIYTIGNAGAIIPILSQPLTVQLLPGIPLTPFYFKSIPGIIWDRSDSFLLVPLDINAPDLGGEVILSFSGTTLSQTVYLTPYTPLLGYPQQSGSLVYTSQNCYFTFHPACTAGGSASARGYSFLNGVLEPLPKSIYYLSDTNGYPFVIY